MSHSGRAVVLVAGALTALAIAGACTGSSGSTPTLPAPTNLAVTAGNKTLHATWSAVAGATGYEVYVSPNPIASTTAATPTVVTSPVLDTTIVNWVPQHVRVAARKGGLRSDLSGEAIATGSAGWVVASVASSPPSLNYLHADDLGHVIANVPNAAFIELTNEQPFVGTLSTALLIGVFTSTTGRNDGDQVTVETPEGPADGTPTPVGSGTPTPTPTGAPDGTPTRQACTSSFGSADGAVAPSACDTTRPLLAPALARPRK